MADNNYNGEPDERSRLLSVYNVQDRRLSSLPQREAAVSIVSSSITKEEQALGGSTIGERLPYNDYTTIDWLHDLVCLLSSTLCDLDYQHILSRSRTPTAIASSTTTLEAFATSYSLHSTLAQDGSL